MTPTNDSPSYSGGISSVSPVNQIATFMQVGKEWKIDYGAISFALRNALGLGYIHRLLQQPGEQIHALDLLASGGGEMPEAERLKGRRIRPDENLAPIGSGDLGPLLDERAKREYRNRISALNQELDQLRDQGTLNVFSGRDYRRRAEIEFEIEALARQLAQAVGIFGRDRPSGSAAERARLNVTRAVRAAVQKIAERNAALGELLAASIKTGAFCAYLPNPQTRVEWRLAANDMSEAASTGVVTAASPPETDGEPSRYQTRFVGREHERELLTDCLSRTVGGNGRVMILTGPPGIGKTRIAREAGHDAQGHEFVVLSGNCYDRDDSVPFTPFVEAIERLLGPNQNPAALRQMLGGQGPELSRLLPQLRLLFPERPTLLQSSPEQSRRVLFNAVQEFIRRQSSAKPLLLVLEDLHWADDGTLSLLIHLARSISSMKLMIIATHRNDSIDMKPPLTKALEELAHLGVVVQIPLRGLPQPAVAQMIAGLSGTEPPPASVELISSSTDGNPLFVEELVRHLAQDQRNENVFQRLDAGEIALPHSLRLLIGQRLALVSGATALFLRTAAVIGRSFNFSLLEAATRAEPDELVDALEEAEKAGLISSRLEYPEAQFRFRHELIRRAVLDEISLARRQRIHLSVAEAMEQLYSALSHEHSDDLAHHFWSAGAAADPAKTLRYLQMAGEKAVQSSANVKAIGHFREALQLLGTLAGTAERQRKKLLLQSLLGTALIAVEVFSSQEVQKV